MPKASKEMASQVVEMEGFEGRFGELVNGDVALRGDRGVQPYQPPATGPRST